MTDKYKKAKGIGIILFLAAFMLIAFWLLGRPMLRFVEDPEQYRIWIQDKGFFAQLSFIAMVLFQVVVAIIPAEPLEICAGYAFGALEGTILCLVGLTIGTAIVFFMVRTFGVKLVQLFFPIEKVRSLRFLRKSKKRNLLAFIVMFIPGTPKDLVSYVVGLTDMKFLEWMAICTVARIPSILTSTVGGDALAGQEYLYAIIVFGVTALISIGGILVYNRINADSKK